MDLTTNSNFLDDINPLDLNSSIPATRDLKDSIRALAMLHGCTMQEYLEQLISTEVNRYDIQKLLAMVRSQILKELLLIKHLVLTGHST